MKYITILLALTFVTSFGISYSFAAEHEKSKAKTEIVKKDVAKPEVKKPEKKKAAPAAVQKKAAEKAK